MSTLDDFLVEYEDDDNTWWRLGSGDHQNLFEEAVERWHAAEAERDAAASQALEKVERAHELYNRAEARTVEAVILGKRAARLVDFMLVQCAPHLTDNFGEINEVLVEAHKKGWLDWLE